MNNQAGDKRRSDPKLPDAAREIVLKDSEGLYRTLAETTPAAVMLTDKLGRCIYANDQAAQLTGYSMEELRDGASLLHPDEVQSGEMRDRVFREGTSGRAYETRFVRKDGEAFWVSVSWEPVRDGDGRLQGLCVSFTDVTERKLAEEAIQASEERYRTLVNNTPGAVYRCALDDDWTAEFLSDAIEGISGYPASDFIGSRVRTYASIIHPEDALLVRLGIAQAVGRGEPYELEYRVIGSMGNTKWVHEKGQGILGEDGSLLWLEGLILDITDRKLAEDELRKTEERYRLLAENASDLLWQMDMEGRLLYVSQAVRRFGYEPEELIGHSVYEFLPPQQNVIFLERHANNTLDPVPKRYEALMYRRDRSLVWLEISLDFVLREGRPVEIQGIARDVSERKKAEQALRESEERYKSIVESTADLIMLTLPNGNVTYLSPSCHSVIGYHPEDLVGTNPDIFHPDDKPTIRAAVQRALGGRSGTNVEYRIISPEGETKWVSHSWSPIVDEDRLQLVVSVVRDITERRLAEETLRRAHADLEKSYNIQREFLNNVTHEVRTPLTAVQGYVSMMIEGIAGPLTEQQEALLRKVLASSDHLLRIVGGVLEVARLKSGAAVPRPKACKPSQTVDNALLSVLPQAHQKGLEVTVEASRNGRMGLYDEEKLAIIVTNLLSNAVKFTERGEIRVMVDCCALGTEIIIADTGAGIPESALECIFEEFSQLDYPGRHKPAGFGLGLAIVASMVDIIGATLMVSSLKGTGTAFTLYVPALEG